MLLALAVVAGCTSTGATTEVVGPAPGGPGVRDPADPGADPPVGVGEIAWGSCDDGAVEDEECGTLEVPLDYGDPDGATIEVAISRIAARRPDDRVGILLVNPGGPGASGVDYARDGLWPDELRDRFDLIGFDPRGIGRSTPIECLSDAELEELFDRSTTPPAGGLEAWLEPGERAEAQCAASEVGRHLGSRNVARDMDEIRRALGEEQLNFYGASYGTVIASAYVDLFPANARGIVMDSVVSPTATPQQEAADQAAAFESLLDDFTVWCDDGNTCPADPRASITELIAAADAEPIPVPEFDGRLSGVLALLGVITAFYTPTAWSFLGEALVAAEAGDVSSIYRLAMFQTDRSPDGTYTNLREALIAVLCEDAAERMTVPQVEELEADLTARFPTFGAASAWGTFGCTGWPEPGDPMRPPAPESAPPPVLVVGTTDDPATPFQGAIDMRDALPGSVLLTFEGSGHVAFGTSGCVTEAVTRYLVDGSLPDPDERCRD